MKKLWAIIVLVLMLTVPFSALALTAKSGENVIIDEAIEGDLYTAGGGVRVAQAVNGDVLAAGGNLRISAPVTGDILGVAGNVNIDSNVSDDVRLTAGSIMIDGEIGGDLVVLAGETVIDAETVVNGDVVIMGGLTEIWGTVRGNVLVIGGELGIYGTVEGSVKADLDSRLRITEDARIGGNLEYAAAEETDIPANVVGGEVTFGVEIIETPDTPQVSYWEATLSVTFFSLLMTLLLGLVIILVMPNFIAGSVITFREKSGMAIIVGFVIVPVLLLAIFLSFISVIGIKLGLLLMAKLMGIVLVAKVFTGYLLGHAILRPKRKLKAIEIFGLFALGLIAIEVVSLIPVLGGLIQFAVYLIGMGVAWVAGYELFKRLRKDGLF